MLVQDFETWLSTVKSFAHSGVANRISACRRVEREKHIDLDEIYQNEHQWKDLLDSFDNYTSSDWEMGIPPAHGIPFSVGSNWYTGTKTILSALRLYDMFKKHIEYNVEHVDNRQHEPNKFSLEACPNDVFQEVMNVEDSARTEEYECKYKSLQDKMRDVFENLLPRERFVIELRHGLRGGKPRSLEEIARICNVTRERIRQIEAIALRKMRHPVRHP